MVRPFAWLRLLAAETGRLQLTAGRPTSRVEPVRWSSDASAHRRAREHHIDFKFRRDVGMTDTAAAKVGELLEEEGNPELFLRVAVRPGGCSGFSYEMFFDTELAEDDVQSSARRRQGRRRPGQRGVARGRDP